MFRRRRFRAPDAPPAPARHWTRRLRRITVRLAALALLGGLLLAWSLWRAPAPASVRVAAPPTPPVAEVTQLYRVPVGAVVQPRTTAEVAQALRTTTGPVSIGGGRYSMGGQTATPGGLQLDLRQLAGVIAVDTLADTARVYAGTTWRALQEALDPLGRAVKVMQTYNNFTVGGALSVNAHGRYIGYGPISMTVRSLRLVLADGSVVDCTRSVQPELYAAALGGYGAVGVITEVTLELARNDRVRRTWERVPLAEYTDYFRQRIAGTQTSDTAAIFHNGDLSPPNYDEVGALTYRRTTLPLTDTTRLRPLQQGSALRRAVFGGFVDPTWRPAALWLRAHVVDPLWWRGTPVTWRNTEASYDVSELEPTSRARTTFVLQEYFVDRDSLAGAVAALRSVLTRHAVRTVNISIRHALADTLPFLTWAPRETFALVLYYAQGTQADDRRAVGRWTREAIDSVLAHGGRYYLPYQAHATRAQFRRAYPGAARLFEVKQRVDPAGRFTNALWDLYAPVPGSDTLTTVTAARYPWQLPGEVRLALDRVPHYDRPALARVIAHPEWDLVWSSDAFRDWLAAGGSPSDFAWMQSIGTFWRSYRRMATVADSLGTVPDGFHSMLMVIGLSTTLEYTAVALYENTVGRLSAWLGGTAASGADRVAARQAADYSELIHTAGWYRFGFRAYVGTLWQAPWAPGRARVREVERRLFLSALWSVKAAYAQLLTWGLGAEDTDAPVRHLVIVGGAPALSLPDGVTVQSLGWRGYRLVTTPRYRPFEATVRALARDTTARVVEVNGSPAITLTARVPADAVLPAGATLLQQYRAVPDRPDAPARQRVVVEVAATDLLAVLRDVEARPGVTVDHLYDF